MTNSLRRRMREHKLKLTPGFAAKYNITRLVYFESFEEVRNAIAREKQIKAWARAKRLALVESTNPKWDVSREWDQTQTFRFVPRMAQGVAARSLRSAVNRNQGPSRCSG
jgi:putative endonuclease